LPGLEWFDRLSRSSQEALQEEAPQARTGAGERSKNYRGSALAESRT